MAYRYKVVYPQTGEVLNPQDWNLNHAELASEFNGYLDRDNLPDESIGVDRVKTGTFVVVHSDPYISGAADVLIVDTSTQWVSNDGTNYIGTVTIENPVDCVLVTEWSGTYENTAVDGLNLNAFGIRFRIIVDGAVSAMSGWFSLGHREDSPYIVGAIPVTAGTHVVTVERQLAVKFVLEPGYYQATIGAGINPEITSRELVVTERRR